MSISLFSINIESFIVLNNLTMELSAWHQTSEMFWGKEKILIKYSLKTVNKDYKNIKCSEDKFLISSL